MNARYLFSIIILILLIMVLKSIQYYYFIKDKQNIYVLILKKYIRFGIILILLTILNLLSIFTPNKLNSFLLLLLVFAISIENLLKVIDLRKKLFLVLNLSKSTLIKKLILSKTFLLYLILVSLHLLFLNIISLNIILFILYFLVLFYIASTFILLDLPFFFSYGFNSGKNPFCISLKS